MGMVKPLVGVKHGARIRPRRSRRNAAKLIDPRGERSIQIEENAVQIVLVVRDHLASQNVSRRGLWGQGFRMPHITNAARARHNGYS